MALSKLIYTPLRMTCSAKLLSVPTNTSRLNSNRKFSLKAGDNLPSIELMEKSPGNKVNIKTLFEDRKGIIFAVPGAFTPTCNDVHLPGFINDWNKWRSQGIEEIVCVSVNDVFVMKGWGEIHKADGKVRMLADHDASFTKAVGMEFDATNVLGGIRSKRYSLMIENGIVKEVNVEPDSVGTSCSTSEAMLS